MLAELAVETGLRWGELAELRADDIDIEARRLTVARTVVELHPAAEGARFVVKHYPKNAEYRQLALSDRLTRLVDQHIAAHELGHDDLLFGFPHNGRPDAELAGTGIVNTDRPVIPTEPDTGRYHRGCCCQRCHKAYADDQPEPRVDTDCQPLGRSRETDGHLPRDWFRLQIWNPAQARADMTNHVRMHDLRHTNASWMLAGGADVETVRERLGHRSLRATERYLHTLPSTHDKALDALDHFRHAA